MPTTPVLLLPYPALSAAPNVPADIQALADRAEAIVPRGRLGYVAVTANQATITVEADLTGIAATVTVGSGRRIRVTVEISLASTVAGDTATLNIKEGATFLQTRDITLPTAGATGMLSASVILTPTAAAHTYKASLQRSAGTGVLNSTASAARPAFILVEDIGV